MSLTLKKILSYLFPTLLAAFIIYDTFVPVVSIENNYILRAVSSISKPTKTVAAVAPTPKPEKLSIPDGTYYQFKANYECLSKIENRKVSSYFDSYQVKAGVVCRTGDACGQKNGKCFSSLPPGFAFSKNYQNLIVGQNQFLKQAQALPAECVMPTCGAIPAGCRYDQMAPLDDKGCPQGCGTLVCEAASNAQCPQVKCAVPPSNCEYDELTIKIENNCAQNCGEIKCNTFREKLESEEIKSSSCPDLKCAKPPENCEYDTSSKYNGTGCQTTCGQIICKVRKENEVKCPEIQCASPPEGCHNVGLQEIDSNGCAVGCRGIACPKKKLDNCQQPHCEQAPPNCRYDGNSPLDFDGCATGCGQLQCSP